MGPLTQTGSPVSVHSMDSMWLLSLYKSPVWNSGRLCWGKQVTQPPSSKAHCKAGKWLWWHQTPQGGVAGHGSAFQHQPSPRSGEVSTWGGSSRAGSQDGQRPVPAPSWVGSTCVLVPGTVVCSVLPPLPSPSQTGTRSLGLVPKAQRGCLWALWSLPRAAPARPYSATRCLARPRCISVLRS